MLLHRDQAQEVTGLSRHALQEVERKLNGLAYMFELEVAAGLIQ
jgi:hypothetical protein